MKLKIVRSNFQSMPNRENWLTRVPITALMPAASVLLAIDLIASANLTNFLIFSGSLAGAAAVMWPRELSQLCDGFFRWQQRHKINLLPLACSVLTTLWWLDFTSAPAHAQFFTQTEDWLRSSFPLNNSGGAGGTDIYALVFNTLRAIFVLYLAVALVKVIAAARNDEDWQSLARTPLIILVTVTLGDILASLITGGGGGATAGG